jgi:hypothetical protein
MFKLAKHVHAKFQLSSFYPDGLTHMFKLFSKFSGFSFENFKIIPNLKKPACQMHLLPKFEPSSIFTNISKLIPKNFDSSPKFSQEISTFQHSK